MAFNRHSTVGTVVADANAPTADVASETSTVDSPRLVTPSPLPATSASVEYRTKLPAVDSYTTICACQSFGYVR